MIDFLNIITSFPTLIFTVMLGFVGLYWLLVIVGALDLEVFEAADALGDGIDSAVDGVLDSVDLDADADVAEAGQNTLLGSMVAMLGLRGVPITLWLSLVILWAWVLTGLGSLYLSPAVEPMIGSLVPKLLVGGGALLIGTIFTSAMVRPVARLFVTHNAIENRSLIGKVCTIATLRVDERFGQAEINDGGAGLLVQVRCSDQNDLTRGSTALIFDYNAEEQAFHVARFDDVSPGVEKLLREKNGTSA